MTSGTFYVLVEGYPYQTFPNLESALDMAETFWVESGIPTKILDGYRRKVVSYG